MEMSGLLHVLASLFPGKKRSQVPVNRRQDWPKIWSGPCGEEKVSSTYQQSNHDAAQYLQYKLHNDLQILRNFICLRSQCCDYDIQVMTPCSLIEELFTLKMDKQVFSETLIHIHQNKVRFNVKLTYRFNMK